MAIRPHGAPIRPAPQQQQVFKPRESLIKFARFYPLILAGLLVTEGIGIVAGYYFKMWLIPIMMLYALFSAAVGTTIARRLSQSKTVIDPGGIRLIQGDRVQAAVAWNQITRLTVRQERGDNVYELWVKNQPIAIPAAYYEHGDQLLSAMSARTNRPWERQRETQANQRG